MWSSLGAIILLRSRLIGRLTYTCLLVDVGCWQRPSGGSQLGPPPTMVPQVTWASLQHGACVPRVSEERENSGGGAGKERGRRGEKGGRERQRSHIIFVISL